MSEHHVRGICRETVGAMSDLMEDALAPGERAYVEAHLADCPRCRELLASLRALPNAIRALARPAEPADLDERILATLGLASKKS